MPAKPSKDFVSHNLIKLLTTLHQGVPHVSEERLKDVQPPPSKRQKMEGKQAASTVSQGMVKDLSKAGVLLLGLNQVQKALLKIIEEKGNKQEFIVFILND